jgi:endonuclease I
MNNIYQKIYCVVALLSMVLAPSIHAQGSDQHAADYYDGAYKLYGTALRSALHNIIDGHTVISYDGLYTAFPSTDSKPNGKIWDIYSDIPGGTPPYEYTHGVKKCGSYSGENDCYNREHSWPDSWLGATNPARSDLFHMYPTDGYVNNRRSNYPFGTVASPTWTSQNGSKVGSNTFAGYSGTVFEPINAYKGDLARSAMYMSVRYYTEDGGFSTSPATNKSDLLPWYANLLLTWHTNDTVSTKEINRNNAIFTFQKNRNPFIDHPEFAAEIWNTAAAPAVVKTTSVSPTVIMIDLSRYLDSAAAVTKTNFSADHSAGNPVTVQWGVDNDVSKILLTFSSLLPGTVYTLQLKNLKSINAVAMKDTAVLVTTSGVSSAGTVADVPDGFRLEQNHPNPFNPETKITFALPVSAFTTLSVFDVLGTEVAQLVYGESSSGVHTVRFDASRFPSGLYVYTLRSGAYSVSKKMLLLK